MRFRDRHGPVEAPFFAAIAVLRRSVEWMRLVYWRRVFGWSIGQGVRVHLSVHIPRTVNVSLADGVNIGRGARVVAEVEGGELRIGRNSSVDVGCLLDASGRLDIGANVTISEAASVYTHSHGRHPQLPPSTYTVVIGDEVWICAHGMVLSAARSIGDGAIIAPYAVIRSPVPANPDLLAERARKREELAAKNRANYSMPTSAKSP